jgi:hypothetical protein
MPSDSYTRWLLPGSAIIMTMTNEETVFIFCGKLYTRETVVGLAQSHQGFHVILHLSKNMYIIIIIGLKFGGINPTNVK